jgi:hypothetical protein
MLYTRCCDFRSFLLRKAPVCQECRELQQSTCSEFRLMPFGTLPCGREGARLAFSAPVTLAAFLAPQGLPGVLDGEKDLRVAPVPACLGPKSTIDSRRGRSYEQARRPIEHDETTAPTEAGKPVKNPAQLPLL